MKVLFDSRDKGNEDKIKINDREYRLLDTFYSLEHKYWLDKWANKKIFDNQDVKELFRYKNQTLWYLFEWLIMSTPLMYFKKRPGLYYIFSIIDTLDKNINEDVVAEIYDKHFPLFSNLLEKICDKKGVKLKIKHNENVKKKLDFLNKSDYFVKQVVFYRIFMRWVMGKIRILFKDARKSDVLILSNIRFSKDEDKDNIIFGDIIKKLNKNNISYKVVNYSLTPVAKSFFMMIKKFLFRKNCCIEDYYSISNLLKNRNINKNIKYTWKLVRNSDSFKKSFEYKGIDIYSEILPRFEVVINSLMYLIPDNITLSETILKKENPKVILIDHEYNFYGKGLMSVSKKMEQPKIIALQHEVVYSGCLHTHIKNKASLDRDKIIWRPLPYKKCCSGESAKKVLLDTCNYPKKIIELTGNPKFDSLINKKYDKEKIIEKYDLDKNEKRVLFAAQNISLLYAHIVELAKNLEGVQVIVKPHPNENMNRFMDYFENKKNIKTVDIDSDLYELISVSDMLITYVSTVALEAMIKKIPVIILNPTKLDPSDLIGLAYIKENVALNATSTEELIEMVKILNENKKVDLLKRMNKFVLQENYKNDGKSADRIIKIIGGVIKKEKLYKSY